MPKGGKREGAGRKPTYKKQKSKRPFAYLNVGLTYWRPISADSRPALNLS